MNTYISFVPKRLKSCLIEGLLVSWVLPAQELWLRISNQTPHCPPEPRNENKGKHISKSFSF